MTTSTRDKSIIGKSSINNNNVLSGSNVMPMKGQTSSNDNNFSLTRHMYRKAPKENPLNHNNQHNGKNSVYQDNSLYLLKKKAGVVGKKSYSSPLSYNSNLKSDVKSALTRTRSSGYVVPTKVNKLF
tara:strand:- start:12049 stop:12429 length:381 start_codon:yes stop_codon:yes gene_type:complete